MRSLQFKDVWSTLTGSKAGVDMQEKAIIEILDKVLASAKAETAFDAVMLANNAAAVHKNNRGEFAPVMNMDAAPLYAKIRQKVPGETLSVAGRMSDVINKALIEPNVAGIPISAAKIETNREIEVSESMVIVQSTRDRKYWTDNAVPRLKEWNIDGYLTVISPLDSGWILKPSLQWQAYYLDICAKSRRPVMFKTNRGQFVKVQITNLHTVEEASYNNAIHVTMSLKEYNPYIVSSDPEENKIAIKVPSSIPLIGGRSVVV
mgnify:CR=1 FL=1